LQRFGHEGAGEFLHFAMRARLVDHHFLDIRPQQVAQHPQMQRQIGVHQVSRLGAQPLLTHEFPQLAQVNHVRPQRFGRASSAAVRTM
jgi:hypothetical protein